jgi:hypothetical protein
VALVPHLLLLLLLVLLVLLGLRSVSAKQANTSEWSKPICAQH